MSFISLQFLIFFPVVTALYFTLPHRFRWAMLLAASCLFYMAFVPAYILILGATILVDYWAGLAIGGSEGRRRRLYLLASIVANIGVLAVFKYYNFFVDNVSAGLVLWGFHPSIPLLRMVLPIGLSFHTFQALSYTIEVYRGEQEPERHLGIYALYVMFYPQLVAGPIERPQNLLHQFHERHRFLSEDVIAGGQRMLWGAFKKMVVADRFAVAVDTVYQSPQDFSGIQLILATVFFAVQVYADFSGYSDIALGAARVMGFRLMKNFDQPYLATSPSDFWRRWHISLYSWFSDYVYAPIAIAVRRYGKLGVIAAVMTTFALSGLWHGAAWTFVLWGAIHGAGISLDLLTKRWRTRHMPSSLRTAGGWLFTMSVVFFGYVFFRADTIADALGIVARIMGTGVGGVMQLANPGELSVLLGSMGFYREEFVFAILGATVMFAAEALHRQVALPQLLSRSPVFLRWSFYYALVAAVIFFGQNNSVQPFIYFQF